MSAARKSLTEGRLYPVVFMVLVTAVFVGVLATFYHSTTDRVERYRQYRMQSTVLELFDLPDSAGVNGLPADSVAVLYSLYIKPMEKDGYTWYRATRDGRLLGWAFPVQGGGLWGSISAMLALSPDHRTILRLAIVDQSETPGLGARITEAWFLDQFRGKRLSDAPAFTLVAEDAADHSPTEVRQITGATSSTRSVVNILVNDYRRISALLEPGNE